MPPYDPRPAVTVANDIFTLVETEREYVQGLVKMCALLHALDSGASSPGGLKRKADFARLVSGIPPVSPFDLADFLADYDARRRFLDVERSLLTEAGADPRLVEFTIERLESRLAVGSSDTTRNRDFERAIRRLRDFTCDEVRAQDLVQAAIARLPKPQVKRETIALLAGLVTTAVDVPLYDTSPVASNLSMNLGCNFTVSGIMALFPAKKEEEGGVPLA